MLFAVAVLAIVVGLVLTVVGRPQGVPVFAAGLVLLVALALFAPGSGWAR